MEIQRAPNDGTGQANAGAAVSIVVLPAAPLTGVTFTDKLPADGVKRFYRYGHVREDGRLGPRAHGARKAPASPTTPEQQTARGGM